MSATSDPQDRHVEPVASNPPDRMFRTLDDALDFELEQTFPASDPLSLTRAAPPAAPHAATRASGATPRPVDE